MLLLQVSIALFTGIVAATLVPPVRKSIPRPIEAGLWIALIVACVIGMLSITSPTAREITSSAAWGVDQIISTTVGLLGAGLLGWISASRFTIATWVVLLCGADILALAMVSSYRKARGWQPQVRLGEWMELPSLALPAPAPVVVPYALDELNRRWAAATAVAGAAVVTGLIRFSMWARDVLLPRQVESRSRLESLRDTGVAGPIRRARLVRGGWRTGRDRPSGQGD